MKPKYAPQSPHFEMKRLPLSICKNDYKRRTSLLYTLKYTFFQLPKNLKDVEIDFVSLRKEQNTIQYLKYQSFVEIMGCYEHQTGT